MKSNKLTEFEVDGVKMKFNVLLFRNMIYERKNKKGCSISDIEEEIAKKVSVTTAAVHNWRSGYNGPGEIGIIQGIAELLEIDDWKKLMINMPSVDENSNKLNELQIKSAKRIYDAVIDFTYNYGCTNDFLSIYEKYQEENSSEIAKKLLWKYIVYELEKVEKAIMKEYFYLRGTRIYDEFMNLYYEYIDEPHGYYAACTGRNVIDEMAGPEYETQLEYDEIIVKVNEIIEKIEL